MRSSKYASQMLKILISEYDSNPARFSDPSQTIDIWELAVKAGIITEEKISKQDFYSGHFSRDIVDAILTEMKERNWITIDGTFNETWVSSLLPAGIDEGRSMMRPWFQKLWHFMRGDVRTVTVSLITSVVTALLTTLLLRMLE